LCMHARKTAKGFYEKLGYAVTGDEFMEVTIPHYIMEKAL
jgi:predicted GNAT family N-acyltransferase